MTDPFAAVAAGGMPEMKAAARASSRSQGAKQFFDVLKNEKAAQRVEEAIFALTNNADDKNYRMRIRQVIGVLKQERFGVLRDGIVRDIVDLHDLVTTKLTAAAVKPAYLNDIKDRMKDTGDVAGSPSTTGNHSKASSPEENGTTSDVPQPAAAVQQHPPQPQQVPQPVVQLPKPVVQQPPAAPQQPPAAPAATTHAARPTPPMSMPMSAPPVASSKASVGAEGEGRQLPGASIAEGERAGPGSSGAAKPAAAEPPPPAAVPPAGGGVAAPPPPPSPSRSASSASTGGSAAGPPPPAAVVTPPKQRATPGNPAAGATDAFGNPIAGSGSSRATAASTDPFVGGMDPFGTPGQNPFGTPGHPPASALSTKPEPVRAPAAVAPAAVVPPTTRPSKPAAPEEVKQKAMPPTSTTPMAAPPPVVENKVPSPRGVSMPAASSPTWFEKENEKKMDSIEAKLQKLREQRDSVEQQLARTRETVQQSGHERRRGNSGLTPDKRVGGEVAHASRKALEKDRAELEREKAEFGERVRAWESQVADERGRLERERNLLEKEKQAAASTGAAGAAVAVDSGLLAKEKLIWEAEKENEWKKIEAEKKRLEVERQVFKKKQAELASSSSTSRVIEEDPQLRAKYEHLKKEYRARSKELEDTKMENTLFKRLEHKRNAEQRVSEEELRYGYEKKIQQLSTVVEEKEGHIRAIEERLAAEIQRKIKVGEDTKARENLLIRQKELLKEHHMREKDLTRKLRSASLSASMHTNASLINSTTGTHKPPLPPGSSLGPMSRSYANPFQKYKMDGYSRDPSVAGKSPGLTSNDGGLMMGNMDDMTRVNPFSSTGSDFPISQMEAASQFGGPATSSTVKLYPSQLHGTGQGGGMSTSVQLQDSGAAGTIGGIGGSSLVFEGGVVGAGVSTGSTPVQGGSRGSNSNANTFTNAFEPAARGATQAQAQVQPSATTNIMEDHFAAPSAAAAAGVVAAAGSAASKQSTQSAGVAAQRQPSPFDDMFGGGSDPFGGVTPGQTPTAGITPQQLQQPFPQRSGLTPPSSSKGSQVQQPFVQPPGTSDRGSRGGSQQGSKAMASLFDQPGDNTGTSQSKQSSHGAMVPPLNLSRVGSRGSQDSGSAGAGPQQGPGGIMMANGMPQQNAFGGPGPAGQTASSAFAPPGPATAASKEQTSPPPPPANGFAPPPPAAGTTTAPPPAAAKKAAASPWDEGADDGDFFAMMSRPNGGVLNKPAATPAQQPSVPAAQPQTSAFGGPSATTPAPVVNAFGAPAPLSAGTSAGGQPQAQPFGGAAVPASPFPTAGVVPTNVAPAAAARPPKKDLFGGESGSGDDFFASMAKPTQGSGGVPPGPAAAGGAAAAAPKKTSMNDLWGDGADSLF